MDLAPRIDDKQWDALLAGIQRLCRIFWGPTEASCQQMLESSFLQPFEALGARTKARWTSDLADLRHLLEGFSDPASLFAYLEQGYVRLFVNARQGIAAPLYASCYDHEADPQLMGAAAVRMGKMLVDLGISIGDDIGEPPDHLAIELETLYYLLTRAGGPDDRPRITRAADFAAQFMIPWIHRFYQRLVHEVHCRFYPLMTAVLLGVLDEVADMNPILGSDPEKMSNEP
jgi:TorA maturation chaperone TorD